MQDVNPGKQTKQTKKTPTNPFYQNIQRNENTVVKWDLDPVAAGVLMNARQLLLHQRISISDYFTVYLVSADTKDW